MTNDVINGSFELVGGCLLVLNCIRLYKDKKVTGISCAPVIFFSAWGLWNLYYYPSLGQWFSFLGGLLIVTVNTIWLGMVGYYAWRVKSDPEQQAIARAKDLTWKIGRDHILFNLEDGSYTIQQFGVAWPDGVTRSLHFYAEDPDEFGYWSRVRDI